MSDHRAQLEQKRELTVAAEIPAAKWDQYGLTEKNRPQKQFTPRDFWEKD
jgi:hypothetical protein